MYGWRCRIGVVLPINNGVMEPELSSVVPDGVSVHAARLRADEIERMAIDGEASVETLDRTGVDVIAYACNLSSFYDGVEGNRRITESMNDAASVPVITATTAVRRALESLGVESVSAVTPYQEVHDERLVAYFDEIGVSVESIDGLGYAKTEEIPKLLELSPADTYRRVLETDVPSTDAALVVSTDQPSLDAIEALEADLGKPVVSSNGAILRHCLDAVGVDAAIEGYGTLLADG